jgi:predicted phosphodiesterase
MPKLCDLPLFGGCGRSPTAATTEPKSLPCSPVQSPRCGPPSPLWCANKQVVTDGEGKCTLRISRGSDIHHITILSDLHIGVAGSGTCTFCQDDDERFASYVRWLTDEVEAIDGGGSKSDLVVVNGDCFELWAPGPSGSGKPGTKELFQSIRETWPLTCDALLDERGDRVVMLNGNHDATLRTKNMFDRCYADLIVDDFSLYAAHGHQSDVWCSDGSVLLGISKLATRVYGRAELIQHDADESSEALQKTIAPKDAVRRCDYRAMAHAEAVAKTLGCRVVAYGHTHVPLLLGTKDVLYCNSGCCCHSAAERRNTVDQLDITRRDVDLGRAGVDRVVRAELSRVDLTTRRREVLAAAERVVDRVARVL